MTAWEQGIVTLMQVVVIASILATLVPRTAQLWRLRRRRDGLTAVRWSTWIKSAGFLMTAAWALVARVDAVWLDRRLMGPFEDRWLVDGAIWLTAAIGAVWVAITYYETVGHHERAEDG